MEFIDTHCHIQSLDYQLDADEVIAEARKDGVTRMLCVGCTLEDSRAAIKFAKQYTNIWATIGLPPHEAKHYVSNQRVLQQFRDQANQPKVVAIGEAGLDYYYRHSSSEDQIKLLRFQLDLAVEHNLPMIFHIRQAFADFGQVLDGYPNVQGVVHSFSATKKELDEILQRGLFVGLNGIMT